MRIPVAVFGVVSCLLVFAAPAQADPITLGDLTIGDPVSSSSWYTSIAYRGGGGCSVDYVQFSMTDRYDTSFKSAGAIYDFHDDSHSSWQEDYSDRTKGYASGDDDDEFDFKLHFDGDWKTASCEFHIEFWECSQLVKSYTMIWDHDYDNDGGRWFGRINDGSKMGGCLKPTSVPEPASLGLLLAGLGSLAVVRRKRR